MKDRAEIVSFNLLSIRALKNGSLQRSSNRHPRWNNHSTPFTPDPLQQLRFFAPSSTVWEGNDSDIKETSIMHGGGGYYKAAHKQREREKGPVAERWITDDAQGWANFLQAPFSTPYWKMSFISVPTAPTWVEHRRVLSRLRSVL